MHTIPRKVVDKQSTINQPLQRLLTEQREHRRLWTLAGIQVRRTDGSGTQYAGVCTDVSNDGFGANVSATFAVGEVVEVQGNDSKQYHLARIIYRNHNLYGFSFLRDH